jgi:hypothetical protein
MGIFGKSFESKETSNVGGGGERVTTHYTDGSSEDKTYDSYGKLVDITHHDSDGDSHTHEVGRGWFGTYTGSRKD